MPNTATCPACRRDPANAPADCAGCAALRAPRTPGWREPGEAPFRSVAAARDEANDATTRRAEEIREATGIAWEHACIQAERERDAARAADPGNLLTPAGHATLGARLTELDAVGFPHADRAAREARTMNSDEQREDRRIRLSRCEVIARALDFAATETTLADRTAILGPDAPDHSGAPLAALAREIRRGA